MAKGKKNAAISVVKRSTATVAKVNKQPSKKNIEVQESKPSRVTRKRSCTSKRPTTSPRKLAKRESGLRRKVLDDQVKNEDGNIDSSQAPSNSCMKTSFVDEQDFMSMSVDQEEEQMYQTDDENHVSEEEEMDSANQSDNESFDENFGSEDDDANQTGSSVEDDEVVLQPRAGTSKSPSNMSNNMSNMIGSKVKMWNKIMKEVKQDWYAGPFCKPPYKYFVQSPLGLVPKDNGRKTRLIFHLSYDFGKEDRDKSINFHTPKHLCSVQYNDLNQTIRQCLHLLKQTGHVVLIFGKK